MKKLASALALASAIAFAPGAIAADFLPGDPNFTVSGKPFTGTDAVSASIGNEGLDGTDFDRFIFTIGPVGANPIGLGSGSITTIFSGLAGGVDDLDFGEVTFFNGVDTFIVPVSTLGKQEFAGLSDVPIFSGLENILTINYTARGQGSYGGTLSFTPSAVVPEPAIWLQMILGFGAIGFVLRKRTRQVLLDASHS
ncbi:hypothetical protein ACFB49_06490 [Sphingomonas sp. DBB INV C78]|uniref:FxDxF family PEP-CTERM protein n=1 Tax=Sphingomonas sp. DBB INV C78 TaxID=3349434 RepID=UPI0036D41144